MNILALETASLSCSVALAMDGTSGISTTIDSLENHQAHSHTEFILPMVDALLQKHNLQIADLDAIAFDCGPGSFTGLRIGAGVAQGLALAHDMPIIKVSSLMAMCHQFDDKFCAVALDARVEEVYFSLFIDGQPDADAQVLKPQDIHLDKRHDWLLLGNGWGAYPIPEHLSGYRTEPTVTPHARDIAQLARYGERLDLSQALPTYTRSV